MLRDFNSANVGSGFWVSLCLTLSRGETDETRGRPRPKKPGSGRAKTDVALFAFDLLELNGEDLRRERQLHLSGGKLDQAAPGDRQSRVASGRALSARRLHRHQHEPPRRAGRRVLQQARDVRAVDQGR